MAVSFNRELNAWQVNGRGAYNSQAEAQAADAAGVNSGGNYTATYDDNEFVRSLTTKAPTRVLKPSSSTIKDIGLDARSPYASQEEFEQADQFRSQGYSDLNNDGKIDAADVALSQTQYGTQQSQGGTATQWRATEQRRLADGGPNGRLFDEPLSRVTATMIGPDGKPAGPVSIFEDGKPITVNRTAAFYEPPTDPFLPGRLNIPPDYDPSAFGGSGASQPTDRATIIDETVEELEGDARDTIESNRAESDSLYFDDKEMLKGLQGGDYGLSDEARQYQQQGLAMQRQLFEKLLDFNPDEYANRFADQALARQIALGRQGTSAAQQQAGMFAAMDQAPALYAEGRRAADALESTRLGQAEQAASSFGELGTMTRGQDEARAQFEASLAKDIAVSVSQLTQGKMQLNQQDSEMLARLWTDFAQLRSIYAGQDSDEAIAQLQYMATLRGQDKMLEGIFAQLRQQGKITSKDLLNGFFLLGGNTVSAAGMIGAA